MVLLAFNFIIVVLKDLNLNQFYIDFSIVFLGFDCKDCLHMDERFFENERGSRDR